MLKPSGRGKATRTQRERRRMERWLTATMLAAAAALAWGAGPAPARVPDASCQGASRVDSALRQGTATTAAGPVGYYRFGRGTPLLLVTGYRATLSEWNSAFLEALAVDHEVIVIDNPGVGRSRVTRVPDDMQGMAGVVSAFIDTMKLGRVDVIGWSMGGMVAQQLAIAHPSQVNSLVLLSTAPPGAYATPVSPATVAVLSGASASPFQAIMDVLFPPVARAQAVKCFRTEMFVPADYGRVRVDAEVAAAQDRAISTWWKSNATADALGRVYVPALVVAGEQDAVLSPRNADALAKLLPDATLHVVPQGGHALMYQEPRLLADAITRFVAKAHRSGF